MKNFWKALGLAAIAAAVVPVKVRKDEETGKKTYQTLLGKVDVLRGEEGGTDIDVTGDGLLTGALRTAVAQREGVLFADDEPEAAVVNEVIDFAEAAKAHTDPEGEEADESDFAEDKDVAVPTPADAAMVEDDEDDDFDPEA